LKHPPSSNFISHSEKYSCIPSSKSWAIYKAAKDGSRSSIAENRQAAPASGIEAQHALMDSFSTCGLGNPAKSVTKKGFREEWVIGIIEDDLPYSLGENQA